MGISCYTCYIFTNKITPLMLVPKKKYICRGAYGLHTCWPHHFSLNYITWSPWQPHKLLLPNYSPCLGPCKWQPPRLPFASALVTDWYQYSGCLPHMCMVPLYKRAGLPGPWLTFWLNVIPVTSRCKTRNLTLTLVRLSVHSTHSY